jgi:predicted permease
MIGIFQEIVTLFAIVGVGYGAKKLRFMNDEFDRMLSKLVINIALPGMILGSVLTATELPSQTEVWLCLGLSIASNLVMFAVAYGFTLLLRIPDGHRGVYRFMLCFGNVGFIGYPVLSAIFGPDALIYAAVFNLPFNLFVFTVGAWFLTQDTDGDVKMQTTWRTFVTPVMLSCVAAVILTLTGIHHAPIAGDALSTLGSITTPAALLIIGEPAGARADRRAAVVGMLPVPAARNAGRHLGRLPRIRAGGTHVLGGRGARGHARGHQRYHALLPVRRQLSSHGPGHLRHHRTGLGKYPLAGNFRNRGGIARCSALFPVERQWDTTPWAASIVRIIEPPPHLTST